MSFSKSMGKSTTSFSIHLDRFIGERVEDGCQGHFISVIGGDAQIAAASAIVSDQQGFTVEGPGLPPLHVNLGEDAQCFRASIPLSSSKRHLRHLIAISRDFAGLDQISTTGRTILAESSPEFLWSSISQIFGLPSVPAWANWFYRKLDEHLAISRIYGLGCDPVLVTGTKQEFLTWLSEGIKNKDILLPEHNGPAVWPTIPLERVLYGFDANGEMKSVVN